MFEACSKHAPNMLDLETALLVITAMLNAGLIFLVLRGNSRGAVNRSFAVFVFCLCIWAVIHIGFRVVQNDQMAEFLLKLSYVCALVIGLSFYYFSIAFPEENHQKITHAEALIITTIALSAALMFPGFLTDGLSHEPFGREAHLRMSGYLIFAALFLFLFISGQVRLWLKIPHATGRVRSQLLAIAGSVTGIGLLGIYFDLLLPSPFFENFRYIWSGPVLTSVFALIVTYAIFRYRLFDLKAAVTELLVFGWWIVILVRALVPNPVVDSVVEQVLIALSAPIGTLLLRSLKAGK